MRRFASSLLAVFILVLIASIAIFLLVPKSFDVYWQQLQLPAEVLSRARTLVGQSPLEPLTELRLYGTLEATVFHAMSELPGRVNSVWAEEGDKVARGTTLVRLDTTQVDAEIAAATHAVHAAYAFREAVAAPPDPALIAVAESALEQARTNLANANRSLEQARANLKDKLDLDVQINQTSALIPIAEAAVGRTQASISQIEVLIAQARTDGSREGKFTTRILERQKAAAEAELKAAQTRLQSLRRTLWLLRSIKDEPIVLEARVRQAEQDVHIAEARLAVAQAERDVAAEAPSAETVAIADAQVQRAEARLALAHWERERLRVVAPAHGRVINRLIEPGETVAPGQPLFTIADLEEMEVRIYIAELDLHRIQVHDNLPVETLALPDQRLTAKVTYIAPEAQFRPHNVLNPDDRGDMVFLVKLRLANPAGILKPGMPADVLLLLE